MELWDIYSRDGKLIGTDFVRGDKLPKGQYHLCAEVLVKHVDGTYLLMKRSYDKKEFKGMLEATAGGSALKGEGPLDCIKRELKEETGLICNDFTNIEYYIFDDHQCLFYCYVCEVDVDKSSVTTQDGETIGYKWVSKEEFIKAIKNNEIVPTQIKRFKKYYSLELGI